MGWAMIRLLIFLESGRCWLWDTCNPSNTSRPIWLHEGLQLGCHSIDLFIALIIALNITPDSSKY